MHLRPNNPALHEGRTAFPIRVKAVSELKRLLQPAGQNGKVGDGVDIILKGKWRGMPCFTITLEERATCPKSCTMWAPCYGNNMRFAPRISADDPQALMERLELEVALLLRTYRKIAVRLHVLGDFFSVEYVSFWTRMLEHYPGLHLWGFTHHRRESYTGAAIAVMNMLGGGRSWVRFSNQVGPMTANVEGPGIPCPEQDGKTKSCMTCGLCWATERPIAFKEH